MLNSHPFSFPKSYPIKKSGKLSDYIGYFTKGTSVQFWWDDDKGWLHAKLTKDIQRNLSRGTIRWDVKMNFEQDDELFSYSFHPNDKRWKVKIESKNDEIIENKMLKNMERAGNTIAKSTKKLTAKKSVENKDKASNKMATCTVLAGCDSSKPNSIEKCVSKRKHGMYKVASIAAAEKSLPEPIDLGLLDKKAPNVSKKPSPTKPGSISRKNLKPFNSNGDAIFVKKAQSTASISFQTSSSYSKLVSRKLSVPKKQETIPASNFHKFTTKTNSNQLVHKPVTSYLLPPNVQSKLQEISSKTIQRSKEQYFSSMNKKAGLKTTGLMTVMTGLTHKTKTMKDTSDQRRPKTHTEKLYERSKQEASKFFDQIMKGSDKETEVKPFSMSSSDESVSSSGSGALSLKVNPE